MTTNPWRDLASALVLVLALGGTLGCPAHTRMAPAIISQVEDTLEGQARTLQVSCHTGPFFRDARFRFLSDRPPETVDLLRGPRDEPITAGAADGLIPAGTRVRILDVQLPTATNVTGRSLLTPRYFTWVLVEVPGSQTPHVLVFRDDPPDLAGFEAMVGRYLGDDSVLKALEGLHPDVQAAIEHKELLAGMRADAAQMAWGFPRQIQRTVEAGVKKERWIYEGGATIDLENDHVKRWETP
ncbi:MAG: hypothetical protein P1V51_03710 [Deltaproteobacteria bacterium]|nr:hypothetical protein [Deltaproteobacteria bacterium]